MEGGRGTTWANFEESAQKNDALMGWPSSRNPLSPTAGRLCREDMAIYGEEPALDSLSLVVCVDCGRVVKSQALVNHKEQYHSKKLEIPVPRPLVPPYIPPVRPPHTVGLPSSAISTTLPVPRGEELMFTASNLPSTSLSGTVGKSGKECDPNRHCGVWMEDEKRQCTHSLNCKIHSLDARQSVRGRSKDFDILLKERKLKKKKDKPKRSDSHLSTILPPSLHSPPPSDRFELASPVSAPSSAGRPAGSEGGVVTMMTSPVETRVLSEEQVPVDMDSFPQPLAVCSYGSRSTLKGGGLLLGRRPDTLRATLATLSGRSRDYSHTTSHRKHSYNSLSRQRAQRKYYNHRHHRQRSTSPSSQPPLKLRVPPQPHPPPHTPSHPLTSPLTASTVLTNINSLIGLPTTTANPLLSPTDHEENTEMPPTRPADISSPIASLPPAYEVAPPISEGGIIDTGDRGSGFLNHSPGDLVPRREPETMDVESTDRGASSKNSGKKVKSRKAKRKKHKHSKSNQDSSVNSEDLLHPSDTPRSRPEDVVRTSGNDRSVSWNSRGEHPAVNGALSDSQQELLDRIQGRSSETPLPSRHEVRVKEEPVSDQEEEAVSHQTPSTTKSPSVGLNGLVATHAASPVHHTVNSPQSFVINPSHQLTSNYPLMTTLSPHVRGMLPIPGMPSSTNLFQPHHHQRIQLAANQVSSPPVTTPPLHPSLQLLPEQLQRQFLQQQQNAALSMSMLANNPALLQQHQLQQQQSNSLSSSGFMNLAAINRTGQQQKSPSMGGVPPSMPQLHQVGGTTGPGNLGKSGHMPPQIFQLPNRTSQGSNKVRAPISHIPSTTQRNLPQLSSLGQAQSIPALNQSSLFHHGKQATPPSSATQRFPSQVT